MHLQYISKFTNTVVTNIVVTCKHIFHHYKGQTKNSCKHFHPLSDASILNCQVQGCIEQCMAVPHSYTFDRAFQLLSRGVRLNHSGLM